MDGQDGSGVWTKHVQLRLCSQVMAAFKGKKKSPATTSTYLGLKENSYSYNAAEVAQASMRNNGSEMAKPRRPKRTVYDAFGGS
jgi:hypothetical protein